MLEQCGIHDDMIEVKGPTQVHNLLELIKKEQNIYDLVFSEVEKDSLSFVFGLCFTKPESTSIKMIEIKGNRSLH